MLIEIKTGNTIQGSENLNEHFKGLVEGILHQFTSHITRLEIFLSDQNGNKGGSDKHCAMEARLAKIKPTAVTHDAETLELAVIGAADKLKHSIEHTLGKLQHHQK